MRPLRMAITMSNEQSNQKRPNPRVLSGFRDFLPAQMRVRQQVTAHPARRLRAVRLRAAGHADAGSDRGAARENRAGRETALPLHRPRRARSRHALRPDHPARPRRGDARERSRAPLQAVPHGPRLARGPAADGGASASSGSATPMSSARRASSRTPRGWRSTTPSSPAAASRDYAIRVNHRAVLAALAPYAGLPEENAVTLIRAIDKLDKIGPEGVRKEMVEHGIPEKAAARVLELVGITGPNDVVLAKLNALLKDIPAAQAGLNDLAHLFEYAAALGVPEGKAVLLPRARPRAGLLHRPGLRDVCAGGRRRLARRRRAIRQPDRRARRARPARDGHLRRPRTAARRDGGARHVRRGGERHQSARHRPAERRSPARPPPRGGTARARTSRPK